MRVEKSESRRKTLPPRLQVRYSVKSSYCWWSGLPSGGRDPSSHARSNHRLRRPNSQFGCSPCRWSRTCSCRIGPRCCPWRKRPSLQEPLWQPRWTRCRRLGGRWWCHSRCAKPTSWSYPAPTKTNRPKSWHQRGQEKPPSRKPRRRPQKGTIYVQTCVTPTYCVD